MGSTAGFTQEARQGVAEVWDRLPEHPFIRGMADGTLPAEAYQFYLEQNLLYLPRYARAIALAVARSRTAEDLVEYTRALVNIVEVEIPQNEVLLRQTQEVTGSKGPRATRMMPGCRDYTSYLLAVAGSGDPADIGALILPCAWSYGEIARAYRGRVADHPVYSVWFDFFATDEYDALVTRMRRKLDAEVEQLPDARRGELLEIFSTATELELGFWDMAQAGARNGRGDHRSLVAEAVV